MDHGSDIWKIKKRKVKPTNLLHQYQMGQFQNIDRETKKKKKSKPNIRAENTNLGFGDFWVKKWWWASFAPSDVYNWLFPCTIYYVQVWILGEERM